MAQRKSPPPGPSTPKAPPATPSSAARGGAKSAGGARGNGGRGAGDPGGRRPGGSGGGPATRPPARRSAKNKSIVNQKQTPWGLIWATVAIVVFAAGVVVAVVATHKSSTAANSTTAGGQAVDKNDPYRQPEFAAAKAIKGVTYRVEGEHTHVQGVIKYDSSPPVGGNHNGFWADCTGTVYAKAIANENAVHMLEHGAIWITYNAKTLPASGVTALSKYVSGIDRMALSPYPNLKTPISLQSWGYQLFVNSASDPRIAQFIAALKLNQAVTPEFNATCSQPTFKQHPSTFGHPVDS